MASKLLQTRPTTAVVLVALTAVAVLLGGVDVARTGMATTATQIQQVACSIPDRAQQTLKLIDAGA